MMVVNTLPYRSGREPSRRVRAAALDRRAWTGWPAGHRRRRPAAGAWPAPGRGRTGAQHGCRRSEPGDRLLVRSTATDRLAARRIVVAVAVDPGHPAASWSSGSRPSAQRYRRPRATTGGQHRQPHFGPVARRAVPDGPCTATGPRAGPVGWRRRDPASGSEHRRLCRRRPMPSRAPDGALVRVAPAAGPCRPRRTRDLPDVDEWGRSERTRACCAGCTTRLPALVPGRVGGAREDPHARAAPCSSPTTPAPSPPTHP